MKLTNKDKERIKELEEEKKYIVFWVCALFGLLIFSAILLGIATSDREEHFQQLQSCQEKIPVWTLRVICDWDNGNWKSIWESDFIDYDMYKHRLDYFIDDENCEVIK